jgi:hypothetical protein
MDLFDILFSWWWYGKEGRTKTADAADKWVLPVLLFACAAVVVVGLFLLWHWGGNAGQPGPAK